MTRLPGSKLRDDIAQALRVKFSVVDVEFKLTATTADVHFIDDTNYIFPLKIAIEAKDWARPLTSDKIASIDNLYRPSLNSGEIDALWIIGTHTLASSPNSAVRKLSRVKYSTINEFNSSLINFHSIIKYNIDEFQRHEAAKNFIQARERVTGETMDKITDKWLRSEQSGLIIFGGYGIGKTTYSLNLAKRYSENYNSGALLRIPIRIALGGMYTKQDLTGLICSALSGRETGIMIPNFSFNVFLKMSLNGQFILILDGFDEMRRAMDLDDFVYTFEQMQPLFLGKAKVIILGRPDSFLSNKEEEKILSSLFDIGTDWSNKIDRVEIAFFTKREISVYVENCVARREISLSREQTDKVAKLLNALPEEEDNILSRAVQLRMFTEILEDFLSSDAAITRYRLYQKFIYGFFVRELKKPARRGKQSDDSGTLLLKERILFIQDIAWWVLNEKRENKFIPSDIPLEIIPQHLRSKYGNHSSLREALVGSIIEPISTKGILDSKAKKLYFFPHKSYIEFLVTEYFIRAKFTTSTYRVFLTAVNAEILSFIEERERTLEDTEYSEYDDRKISGISLLREGLRHMHGEVDMCNCVQMGKI
jgi:predicted NACHT family NTPase